MTVEALPAVAAVWLLVGIVVAAYWWYVTEEDRFVSRVAAHIRSITHDFPDLTAAGLVAVLALTGLQIVALVLVWPLTLVLASLHPRRRP